MLNITIGTNTTRKKVIIDPNKTIEEVLKENNINLSVGTIHLNGARIQVSDLSKTFSELGVTDGAFLISIAKADNA